MSRLVAAASWFALVTAAGILENRSVVATSQASSDRLELLAYAVLAVLVLVVAPLTAVVAAARLRLAGRSRPGLRGALVPLLALPVVPPLVALAAVTPLAAAPLWALGSVVVLVAVAKLLTSPARYGVAAAVGVCVATTAIAAWPALTWVEDQADVRQQRASDDQLVDDYLHTLNTYEHPIYTFSGNVDRLPEIAAVESTVVSDIDPRTSLVTAPAGTEPPCEAGTVDVHAVPVPSGTDPEDYLDAVTTTCTTVTGGAVLAEETTVFADGRPTSSRYTVVVPEPDQTEVIIRVGPDAVAYAGPVKAAEDLVGQVVLLDPSTVSRADVRDGYVAFQH
ncbi:hypothetical protein ABLE68_01560 [Nocardioides sp. CN2-186]|uniref:hypothetical protein n=1 Tax=Nocardioides tweenelious TaxID=3156607 RepID=UPI0032B4F955